MNSEFSPTPQEELEAQITALLLGELPREEATALRERIAADPALRKLHTQIGMTIGLVKEAITSPQPAEIAAPESLRLSEERREKLLASFKVVKVPGREVRIDFKTWGALAAMIAGLLTFTYWMMGAFSARERYSVNQLAAMKDSKPARTTPQNETRRLASPRSAPAAAEPERGEILVSGSRPQESATQDVRFRKELHQAAGASAAGGGPVEENRLGTRIELPKVIADTEIPSTSQAHDPAGIGALENPAPAGPKPEGATVNFSGYGGGSGRGISSGQTMAGRGFYDQSAAGQPTAGLAETAASSSTFTFGIVPATPAKLPEIDLKDLEQNLPGQMQNLWGNAGGPTGQPVPEVTVITGTDAMQVGGESQIAQQDSRRLASSLAREQLGKPEVVLKQDKDEGNISENLGKVNKPLEGRSDTASAAETDRLDEVVRPKKTPEGSLTAAAETGPQYDPLAFYRRNPELMKRYFPRLAPANEAKQPLPTQLEGAGAGLPAIGEIENLRRAVKTQEQIRDSLATRILQERMDLSIPKPKTVVIVDPAEATESTFWERIRGAERTALVEKGRDTPDIGSIITTQTPLGYDPYFLQTEAEKVKSSAVLGEVVDKLNLSQEWGTKTGGQKIEKQKAVERLRKMVNVEQSPAGLIEIKVRSKESEEAARIANAVAEAYRERSRGQSPSQSGIAALEQEMARQESTLAKAKAELQRLEAVSKVDAPVAKPVANAPVPQPEMAVDTNPFSTFSLNVSDVSFKLAAASLEKGQMPDASGIRSEEFINAFDYRDPTAISAPVAFAWERARYPFAHDRDLLRFSVKTAASGREGGRPLNLVLLLDSSGSMERADRVRIIQECLRILAGQLQAQDKVSVVTFARTARLWVDGLPGSSAGELVTRMGTVTPEGGTNLEEAMRVGYETAVRHFIANGVNRVVLLTDGAANLGEVNAEVLKKRVEENRQKGIALDCFGIGWEGLNDDLLDQLSRNGDGRYGFVNTPEAASAEFAGQLAGALKVAASDVKVQVEFNPKRASAYRQIGYAKHQLTKEQFRDNTVDAAEIGAAEAGNALYVVQTNPAGEGPIATVRVRFKVPGTNDYREHEWPVPYEGAAKPLEQSSPGIRLAAAASGFSEWLAASPYAGEITPDRLLGIISNVPEAFPKDPRPKQLEWMIRQAKSIAGK